MDGGGGAGEKRGEGAERGALGAARPGGKWGECQGRGVGGGAGKGAGSRGAAGWGRSSRVRASGEARRAVSPGP